MQRKKTPNRENIERTALALGLLRERFVFAGGAIVELLLTDMASSPVRVTEDVDVIVAATTTADYHDLYPLLARCGFSPDTSSGVLCRFTNGQLLLDVMPSQAHILGFSNPWYVHAIDHKITLSLTDDIAISVIDAVHFIATKITAFINRGRSDYFGSHDFEDIITVIDGRSSLADEIAQAPFAVRDFLRSQCKAFVNDAKFAEGISANLPPDAASQARRNLIYQRIERIAHLPN
jgi:predicted nucleotidyltransferase